MDLIAVQPSTGAVREFTSAPHSVGRHWTAQTTECGAPRHR